MTLPEAEYRANVPRLSAQLSAEHVRGVHEDALPLGLHAALKLGCVVKVGGEGGEEWTGALQGVGPGGRGRTGGVWGEGRPKCTLAEQWPHFLLVTLHPPPPLQVHQPSQSKSLAADWTLEDFQVGRGQYLGLLSYLPSSLSVLPQPPPSSFTASDPPPPPPPSLPR